MHRLTSLGKSLTFQVLLIAVFSRLALMTMNWFSFKIFRVFERGYPKLFDELIPGDHPLAGWSRWDAAWYALVAFDRDSGITAESAMKYSVLGAIASGALLFGISMLYGVTGSLGLD